jgi:hypothetical protein
LSEGTRRGGHAQWRRIAGSFPKWILQQTLRCNISFERRKIVSSAPDYRKSVRRKLCAQLDIMTYCFLEAMMEPTETSAIHCSIDVEHQSGSVSLRGRVVSSIEVDGNYRLEIRSDNRLGSSNVRQAGQFHANANERVFVGFANFNTGARMRLVAGLTVKTSGANRSCKAEQEISDE